MRHAQACSRCRIHKRKCTTRLSKVVCDSCLKHSQDCSFSKGQTDLSARSSALPSIRPTSGNSHSPATDYRSRDESITLSEELSFELVQAYLSRIHDRPHSLFHIQTLWQDIRSRIIPKCLLYSLCSFGCSLSRDPSIHALGGPLTREAKRLLQADIENISLANIQTCILVANLCAAERSPNAETLYFGIANRMAHILKLHELDPSEAGVLRETKGRVFYTLLMADNWCSAGLGLPRQLYQTGKSIPLPIDEAVFQSAPPDSLANFENAHSGLWAYMITLVDFFPVAQDLNRRLVNENLPEHIADALVEDLAGRLDAWCETLPSDVQLNEENFAAHRAKGLGGPFIGLHLGYHHYATLLFFQYLDLQRFPTAVADKYARRCRYHASSFSNLLRESREREGCEAVYATVAHMTVVSSSVLLHQLLFGDHDELAEARANLTSNFVQLLEMKQYWPKLEPVISRLFTFQNACLLSASENTHRIDRWMVRFLLEHSLPLDDRMDDCSVNNTAGNSSQDRQFSERELIVNHAMDSLRG